MEKNIPCLKKKNNPNNRYFLLRYTSAYIFTLFFVVSCQTKTNSISNDVEPFLKKYFSSWSQNDMRRYKDCFDKQARIIYLKRGKVAWNYSLIPFIKKQSDYLSNTGKVIEKMTSFAVDEDKQAATATVQWIFEGDGKKHTGVDRFTLMRNHKNEWKIVALVWYQHKSN